MITEYKNFTINYIDIDEPEVDEIYMKNSGSEEVFQIRFFDTMNFEQIPKAADAFIESNEGDEDSDGFLYYITNTATSKSTIIVSHCSLDSIGFVSYVNFLSDFTEKKQKHFNSTIVQTKSGYRTVVGIQDGTEHDGPFDTLKKAQMHCFNLEKVMNGNDIDMNKIPVIYF